MTQSDTDFTDYFALRATTLRQFAYALCGDWHTAEDLVQTTFVRLYLNWRRLRRDSLDAYTRRVLVNVFLSHRRDRRRERVVAEPPEVSVTDATDASGREEVGRALQRLPARQRAVVVLRHLEDMSVAEVADLLGMAEGTVKSQTARGVEALRQALKTPAPAKER